MRRIMSEYASNVPRLFVGLAAVNYEELDPEDRHQREDEEEHDDIVKRVEASEVVERTVGDHDADERHGERHVRPARTAARVSRGLVTHEYATDSHSQTAQYEENLHWC